MPEVVKNKIASQAIGICGRNKKRKEEKGPTFPAEENQFLLHTPSK